VGKRFALVTDTTADLPKSIIEEYNIYMMPQIIVWGRESLREGIDINPADFYSRLATAKEMPTTSRPVPSDAVDLFQRARDENDADELIVLTVSADVSGTVSTVEQAMKDVDFPVHLLDTRTVSLALGITTLKVAQARDAGATTEEALDLARRLAFNSHALFSPGTLEFLYRGGRIGGARHLVGTALSIKPILTIQDGHVEALESVRTRRRALKRLIELADERIDRSKPLLMGIVQANVEDEGKAIAAEAKAQFNPDLLIESWLGASIGVHAGPGVMGVITVQ
jgi:DegV family protein with EDD domain